MEDRYQSVEKIIQYRLLTASGLVVCIFNFLILIVINTNRDLRNKMCLQSFMAVADMVNLCFIFLCLLFVLGLLLLITYTMQKTTRLAV